MHPVVVPPPADEGRDGRWWLWLVALVAVVGIVVAGVLLLGGGKKVAVPDVVNRNNVAAELALRNLGFSTDSSPLPSDSAAVGIVISQQPDAGTKLKKGGTVHLVVSSGPHAGDDPVGVGHGSQGGGASCSRTRGSSRSGRASRSAH